MTQPQPDPHADGQAFARDWLEREPRTNVGALLFSAGRACGTFYQGDDECEQFLAGIVSVLPPR